MTNSGAMIRAQAARDQAWTGVKNHKRRVKAIMDRGGRPVDDVDKMVIASICSLILSEIWVREEEYRSEFPSNGENYE